MDIHRNVLRVSCVYQKVSFGESTISYFPYIWECFLWNKWEIRYIRYLKDMVTDSSTDILSCLSKKYSIGFWLVIIFLGQNMDNLELKTWKWKSLEPTWHMPQSGSDCRNIFGTLGWQAAPQQSLVSPSHAGVGKKETGGSLHSVVSKVISQILLRSSQENSEVDCRNGLTFF